MKDTIYRQDAIGAIHCDITVTGRQNAELVAATILSDQSDSINRIGAIIRACSHIKDDAVAYDVKEALLAMPSAEPAPIRINLNEPIKVKLTDWGKEVYYHQYDRINQIAGREVCKPRFPREDENGYTEFQLWCFIELYGIHIGMALPNVIEPLEIIYGR